LSYTDSKNSAILAKVRYTGDKNTFVPLISIRLYQGKHKNNYLTGRFIPALETKYYSRK